MESWGWLVAYVVGFGLLQVVLYQYVQRRDPSPEPTGGRRRGTGGSATAADTEFVRCDDCGTRNRQLARVRYCRECTGSLR